MFCKIEMHLEIPAYFYFQFKNNSPLLHIFNELFPIKEHFHISLEFLQIQIP